MTGPEFHRTQTGAQFFRRDVPELLRQLARLNENLERLTEAVQDHPRTSNEGDTDDRQDDDQEA